MSHLVITIDGPAASGKSTVARLLAEKIDAAFLDTGAMYRAVTFAAIQADIDLNDQNKLSEVLTDRQFHFEDDKGIIRAYIDEIDVTEKLRDPKITANAKYVASAAQIRLKLVQMQRRYAHACQKVVTEGRDQGTVAFPMADIKFFLTADLHVRAQRRHDELTAAGNNESLEDVQKAIDKRDKSDQNRDIGPLKSAPDAIIVNTTNLTIEQVVEKLLRYVTEKCSKKD
ncbi:MAG: (d)CMP kinase [Planctomycetota bacterium]|jgi:cytidylate kinase